MQKQSAMQKTNKKQKKMSTFEQQCSIAKEEFTQEGA